MAATPNYAGMFLRGYGSQNYIQNNGSKLGNTNTNHTAGQLGIIQGDAIRNMTGDWASKPPAGYTTAPVNQFPTGVFDTVLTGQGAATEQGFGMKAERINFSVAYVTPTANEIRPANIAVRYLIRTR